jgi:multiple sugar transport system permease protein
MTTTLLLAENPAQPERRRTPHRRSFDAGTFVAVTVLVLFSVFILLPLIWMLSASLRTQGDLTGNPSTLIPTAITWDNYISIWARIPLGQQFVNTIVFAGSVTLISLALDAMAAYALARFDFPFKRFIFAAIIATLLVPIQVTFIPVYNILVDWGLVNTLPGLVLPRIADAFGIFFLRQFFLALPTDLEDAARIDGASEWQIFRKVMLPLAAPALLTVGMFTLVNNWNDLLWPLMVMTDIDQQTLSAGLAQFRGQYVVEYGPLMAGSVIALLPMVIAFLFVQRRFIESIATTGMK